MFRYSLCRYAYRIMSIYWLAVKRVKLQTIANIWYEGCGEVAHHKRFLSVLCAGGAQAYPAMDSAAEQLLATTTRPTALLKPPPKLSLAQPSTTTTPATKQPQQRVLPSGTTPPPSSAVPATTSHQEQKGPRGDSASRESTPHASQGKRRRSESSKRDFSDDRVGMPEGGETTPVTTTPRPVTPVTTAVPISRGEQEREPTTIPIKSITQTTTKETKKDEPLLMTVPTVPSSLIPVTTTIDGSFKSLRKLLNNLIVDQDFACMIDSDGT